MRALSKQPGACWSRRFRQTATTNMSAGLACASAWELKPAIEPKPLELVQYAARPLILAILVALAVAFLMRGTYPR